MKKLIKGLRAFQANIFPKKKELFERLATQGQSPEVLFITCSDSRIDPHMLTSSEPGELFVVRNPGNVVSPQGGEAAAIEFAIKKLGIKDIVVCGHTDCGAVHAAGDEAKLAGLPSLASWVKQHVRPQVKENVLAQVENLQEMACVRDAGVSVHAWVYNIETGEVEFI